MESKKTSKADLNEKRGTFFVLGIILALSLLFVSLEYTSKEFDSFLEDEYLDDLAQDFELLPSMDEEEELETASPQERTTVLTENIKVTEEVPSEIDNTSIPTPLIEQEVTEDMTNEKETDEQTPPNVAEQAEEP
ncbi:MAG: hypothetical protein IIT63_05440, partial [Prevotella sp.]|nr:hypothetical protein [Prevotella sp.]